MKAKLNFNGTGGELFKELFVGALLTSITLGIYLPWYLVSLNKLITSRTKMSVGNREVFLDYRGTGGELLKRMLLGNMLMGCTLGIYAFWYVTKLVQFHLDALHAVDDQGTKYRLRSSLTGGQLFKKMFLGGLLCSVTLGIYAPWFLCNLARLFAETTAIERNEQHVDTFRFTATGGELVKTFLLGSFLTSVTLGIYMPWFQVKMLRFMTRSTRITFGATTYSGDFTGEGGENFKINFVGYLLTMVTFGIYGFWYMANVLKFQLSNLVFLPAEELAARDRERALQALRTTPKKLPASTQPISSPRALPVPADTSDDGRAGWASMFLPVDESVLTKDEPMEAESVFEDRALIERREIATREEAHATLELPPPAQMREVVEATHDVSFEPASEPPAPETTAELTPTREAELAAMLEAELAAQREAELAAQHEAELAAQRQAELAAQREAELAAARELKQAAEREAQLAAEREAKLVAELAAEREARLNAEREVKLAAEREAKLAAEYEANRVLAPSVETPKAVPLPGRVLVQGTPTVRGRKVLDDAFSAHEDLLVDVFDSAATEHVAPARLPSNGAAR